MQSKVLLPLPSAPICGPVSNSSYKGPPKQFLVIISNAPWSPSIQEEEKEEDKDPPRPHGAEASELLAAMWMTQTQCVELLAHYNQSVSRLAISSKKKK